MTIYHIAKSIEIIDNENFYIGVFFIMLYFTYGQDPAKGNSNAQKVII